MRHIHLILPLLLLLAACQPKPSTQLPKAMPTIHYTDGGSNRYILSGDTLQYIPIKPHLSSSGTADGGDPKTLQLSPGQVEVLRSHFDKARQDRANHITQRLMGCGTLTTEEGGKESTVFIAMNATSKSDLEAHLKALLQ